MDSTPVIAVGEAAEDLLNYLVAYRNLRGSLKFDLDHESVLEDNITFSIISREELIARSRKLRHNISR